LQALSTILKTRRLTSKDSLLPSFSFLFTRDYRTKKIGGSGRKSSCDNPSVLTWRKKYKRIEFAGYSRNGATEVEI